MNNRQARSDKVQKAADPQHLPKQQPARQPEQGPVQTVAAQVAYQRAQDKSMALTTAELFVLQRKLGNYVVQDLIQHQNSPTPAVLTDAQQWDQDWANYPGQQHYFAGSDRPSGTPRHRYDVLCPLYKAHSISRPLVYMATSIKTAKFYSFSTPAHTDLVKALATAEATLTGKGYTTAPVKSVWALNPRTTSTGAWSNHADGKAVDLDPADNPHLHNQKERKIITLVTDTNMEIGGQGYDVMKSASNKFKADYNPAGLQRRIAELKAVETAKAAERDTTKAEREQLKEQRDKLKAERQGLSPQHKAIPQGKKATADDVAKVTTLKASIKQKDADLKQVVATIKQKERELNQKEAGIKSATKDRELLEKQLTNYEATEKAIADLENAVRSLPDEIQLLEEQIAQGKQDAQDAKAIKDVKGVREQQKLRATIQRSLTQQKNTLKKQQRQLDAKKKQRDADPLRQYAADGFLNLAKDVVDALTGAGLKWGGNWKGAKDFMHFEL